jgi:NADPH:quinone reductase-like Zn-dependent oxidoreductase
MKAVRIHRFGDPDVLQFEEIAVPSPKEGEVLVQVSGAGTNPVDYKIRAGKFPRITAKELPITLGRDICGTVQKSGADPDEVIALLNWDLGGYAQFAALPRTLCVPKPRNMSAVDAAAIPLAAMTAWQGLFEYGQLQAGQKVLVHAGSGGVGHFAVQFAASRGARVTSTASHDNLEFVRELGADVVIDYASQRFEQLTSGFDVVLDLLGGETRARSWGVLRRGGILVSTLGQPDEAEAAKHGVRAKGYMTQPNASQLSEIVALIEQQKVRAVITKTFGLEEAAAAHRYLEQEHPRGKVVLAVHH